MRQTKTRAAIFCSVAFLIGCSGSSPDEKEDLVRRLNRASSLEGEWQASCLDSQIVGLGERVTFKFREAEFQRQSVVSLAGGCMASDIEAKISGQFERRAQARGLTFGLNLVANSAQIKPLTSQAVAVLNLAKTCGVRVWKVNEIQDITPRLGEEGCYQDHPQNMFTIYSVDEGRLFFGAGSLLRTTEQRPVEIDRAAVFVKK